VLCIDDYGHTSHYYADWVLNQNMSANESFYQRREPYTRLLLGTRYVLLRKEFSVWCGWQREIVPIAHKVLVTLGGSDPDNVALKVLHALKEANVSDLAVRILVGPMSSNLETLRLAIGDATSGFHVLADATNIPELMAWADVAISAGGSTCWELAFMGVPTLVVILSENQLEVAESLAAKGVVVNLGWHQRLTKKKISEPLKAVLTSAEQRLIWSERARALVDGDGAARVVMELKGEKLRLRKACAQDRRLVWEWANDLSTRAASFSSELIVWDTHIQWFNSKLKDPNCLFLIAVDETDTPVGQIRFDFDANKAVVSITTALTYRGRGFGTTIIQRASIKLFQETAVDLIRAYVKPDNTPSIRAFIKAGYRRTSACVVRGNPAYEFTFQRTDVCLD